MHKLLVQYEQQSFSTTNVEATNSSPQIQQTQYIDYHIESQHEGPSSYTQTYASPQMIVTSLILNSLNLVTH